MTIYSSITAQVSQVLLLFYAFFLSHAVYISVTDITYNQTESALLIKVKTFTDDLEDGIYNLTGQSVSLSGKTDLTEYHKSLINRYLYDKIKFLINGRPANFNLIKSENEADATWSYLEVTGVNKVSKIEIRNSMLTELFPTQINVVSLNVLGVKRFLRLSKDNESETVSF